MRIAIIGSRGDDSLESNLQEAFSFAGNDTRIFDIYDLNRFRMKRIRPYTQTIDKILRTYSERYDVALFAKLFERVKDFSPELIICVYRFVHPSFVERCKKQGAKVIHINPDQLSTLEYQQIFASDYDAWFSKDSYMVSFMTRNMHLNAVRYNEAFNIRRHIKPEMEKATCERVTNIDVLTYGTMYPYRCRMLKAVVDSGVNLKIFGVKPHRFYDHKLDSCYENKYIVGEEKARLLYGAKIVFNQMHYAEIESVNNRFFEANGCGAFQLSDYRPILHELLPIDPNMVSFRDIDEGIDKIKYYLNHDQERLDIAKTIYNHFVQHYTYDHLVKYIIERTFS